MDSGRLIHDDTVNNFIAGEWKRPSGSDGTDVINPATTDSLAYVGFSTADDVDEAVAAGVKAFNSWHTTPVEHRIQPMFRFKQLLEENQEALAELLVKEHGKTFTEAMGELRRGIENVEVACGIPSMMQIGGTVAHAAPDIDEMGFRHPLGVFVAITPFNFPGMIPLWFLPYAIATGNTFILKPSERDPLVPQRLVELADKAGFPPGVVSLVNGGPETVDAMLNHPDISGVSFVGSTPIAKHVYGTAATQGKRVQAQGGAKNHILVTANADLAFAADQTVRSAFANAGERCLANPVSVVEASVYEEFVERVVSITKELTVGDGLDDVDMGPLITAQHRETVKDYIEKGIDEGANLVLDGRETLVPDTGYYLGPSVFSDITPDMVIAKEEIFGPVLAIIRSDDFDSMLDIQAASKFGNAASLFTQDGGEAKRFRHEAVAGNLGVNVGTAAPMAFFHFGGRKDSFFGDLHAQGKDMIYFYTDEVTYIERWPNA